MKRKLKRKFYTSNKSVIEGSVGKKQKWNYSEGVWNGELLEESSKQEKLENGNFLIASGSIV